MESKPAAFASYGSYAKLHHDGYRSSLTLGLHCSYNDIIHTLTIERNGVVIALWRETPGFGLPSQLNARLGKLQPGGHFL
ncbi:MAG TPA: hypothetical protein VEH30_07065 [Terriglobales bacterium]|nr:hypothetical protein [Terriglobales bacterium]